MTKIQIWIIETAEYGFEGLNLQVWFYAGKNIVIVRMQNLNGETGQCFEAAWLLNENTSQLKAN